MIESLSLSASLVLRPSSGGGGGWTPAKLFENGELGVWYDPVERSSMLTDTAGTTPVTSDGDALARINDLEPAASNDLLQANASYRPRWKTDGTYYWMQSDGFDDFLGPHTFSAPIPQPFTIVLPIRYTSGSILLDSSSLQNRVYMALENGILAVRAGLQSVHLGSLGSDDGIWTICVNGNSSWARKDGISLPKPANPGSNAIGGLTLFANKDGGGASAVRLYRMLLISRELSIAEAESAERWAAKNCSVTLP